MLRYTRIKRSILPAVPLLYSHTQQIHVTPSAFVRRVLSRNASNNVESEYLEGNSEPLLTRQNSSTDFLGIENNEGVINLKSQKGSMPQPTQNEKLKEKFYSTSFGIIRYDSDNKLKFHGEFENKRDFAFPYTSNETVKVCKSLKSSSKQPVNYSETLLNDKEINENYELHSFEKKEQVSYIDDVYFSSTFEREDSASDKQVINPSSEELNFIDKNYFGALNTSENICSSKQNSFAEKGESEMFVEREHSAINNNNSESASHDLNFFDKSYCDVSETEKSPNMSDFTRNVHLNKEVYPDYNKKEAYKVDSIENFDAYMKSASLLNDTSLVKENSSHILNKDAEYNHHNSKVSSKIKSEGFANENIEITKHNRQYVNNYVQKLNKQTLQNNWESTNSTFETLKKDLTSKGGQLSENVTKAVKSYIRQNDVQHSSLSSEESIHDDDDDDDGGTTAYDFVTKLRKEQEIFQQNVKKGKDAGKEKFDSKGFRILKDQVDDLSKFTRDEVIDILKCNVVYYDDDLLILNKPYNLVMHESETTSYPCLSMFLDDLAKEVDKQAVNPKLFTVHRLDKETTGCLLLARNEMMAQYLKSLFAQRKIIKKYWIITTRVPDPSEGIIDIPISEGSINNRKRMVLNPDIPEDVPYKNHSKHGKQAITSYKVLSHSGNAALVEAISKTGIKHQIRVHFGFGLSCPILGDHKYSHLDKLAPQKLQSDLLQRLHVRQSKVRYIPMHIHAKSVIIPEYLEQRSLLVHAPLPYHMKINLKRLKFKKKDMF